MKSLFPGGLLGARYVELGLKNGLDEVGYDKLTGEHVYQGLQKLTGTDSKGISGPCAYSPTSRKATAMVRFYRVQSGKSVPITDWVEAPDAVSLHQGW